jgi:hypothetical protein
MSSRPAHNTDRLTSRDRQLYCELEKRRGTFSADELAAEFGMDWSYVRDSLLALLAAKKLWRAADGLVRYTRVPSLRRQTPPDTLGRTAEPARNCGATGRRVNHKANNPWG